MARRLISRYPRSAAGTVARDLAKAGGSRTIVSNRSALRAIARSVSKTSASRHSMFVRPLSAALAAPRVERLAAHVERQDARGAPARCSAKEPW